MLVCHIMLISYNGTEMWAWVIWFGIVQHGMLCWYVISCWYHTMVLRCGPGWYGLAWYGAARHAMLVCHIMLISYNGAEMRTWVTGWYGLVWYSRACYAGMSYHVDIIQWCWDKDVGDWVVWCPPTSPLAFPAQATELRHTWLYRWYTHASPTRGPGVRGTGPALLHPVLLHCHWRR